MVSGQSPFVTDGARDLLCASIAKTMLVLLFIFLSFPSTRACSSSSSDVPSVHVGG